jgi:hypothetical protein
MLWKIPMTPSEIKPATFRLVVQCLDQLPHHMPSLCQGTCRKYPMPFFFFFLWIRILIGHWTLVIVSVGAAYHGHFPHYNNRPHCKWQEPCVPINYVCQQMNCISLTCNKTYFMECKEGLGRWAGNIPIWTDTYIQWKPLIMITLGPALFDNNNRLITLSGGYKNLHYLTECILTTFNMYKKQLNLFKKLM